MSTPNIDIRVLAGHISQVLGEVFFVPEDTNAIPISGGEYQIFQLTAESQVKRVSVRIPNAPLSAFTGLRLEREADIRRHIDAAALNRFQPLLACDCTINNPVDSPFMVLGWAEGRPLQWSPTLPKSPAQRAHVLRDIANTSLDLLHINQPGMSTCTVFCFETESI